MPKFKASRPVVLEYDFAKDGGAQGNIALRGPAIPSGAIVTDALIEIDTAVVGSGASLAIKIEGAADVQAVAAVSGAPWSTTGRKRASALTATTVPIKTTAKRQPSLTVSAAVLTAGKLRVILTYLRPST